MPSEETDGVNISATYLTEEIVELVHSVGKRIGVWLERAATKETQDLYEKIFSLKVDFVFLDVPLPGMKYRDERKV